MKFMRYAFIVLLFVTGNLSAQDLSSQLPVIIPPSPAIAAIANKTTLSGSMYTGAATVNVPLYDLKVGSLQLPLMLNYSSNGIKVNDIPSRVGLGWDLIAGGTISKVIHDEDDDDPTTIRMDEPNTVIKNEALLEYLKRSVKATYDTEFDEFSYNVAGLSGKFFYDRNGDIQYGEKSDVKIVRVTTGFVLTTGDGIQYEFKDIIEKTKELKFGGFLPSNKIKTTAWFLTKITSVEGDWIQFHYNPIQIKSYLGLNQTALLKTNLPHYQPDPDNFSNCGACGESIINPVQDNVIEYITYYLSTITTSNGYYVGFLYAPRPQPEQSKDNRLTGLLVHSTSPSKLIKKYKFEYQDFTITNDINQRFYLKKIYDDQIAAPFTESLIHTFDYITPANLPSQKSLNQDFFGYANNAYNVNNFFPLLSNYADYSDGFLGANRNPHPETAKNGLLQKVTFPTGGYQSFEFEPHILTQPTTVLSGGDYLSDPGITFIAGNELWSSSNKKVVTRDIYITDPHVKIYYLTNVNPSGPDVGQPNYWTPDNVHPMSMLKVFDVATNTLVWGETHFFRSVGEFEITLPINKTYRFEATAYSHSHAVTFSAVYNQSSSTIIENKIGCGLRVKKINSYDPATAKSLQKKYFYSSIEDLCAYKSLSITNASPITPNATLKSSGVGKLTPLNNLQYQHGKNCVKIHGGEYYLAYTTEVCTNIFKVGSGSLINQFLYNGSPIAYTSVIESEDENFTKGGIEHQFYVTDNTNSHDIVNSNHDVPEGITSRGNGSETFTATYKSNGDATITLLNSVANIYDRGNYKVLKNFSTRKRFEEIFASYDLYHIDVWLAPFDLSAYYHETGWNYLQKTISKTYDENGLNPITQTTDYVYNKTTHFKPTSIITTSSADNLTITKNFKYPGDFLTAPYPAMVTKHIINPVIEEQTLRNGVELAVNTTGYAAWTGAMGTFYKPGTMKTKKAGFSTENRISFYAYDLNGNPQELSKVNDSRISYLWNYKNSYPVAEVKNATLNNIAYTGFEGDDYGNWMPSAFVSPTTHAFTGLQGYSGSLTKAVSSSKTYIVTLWTSGSATVNGLAGTQVLTAKGSWKLYRWQISGVSNVTVSGTDMDDVRLYPKEAEMTSATYIPFIGKSSEMDAGGNVRFYEYDEFNRLRLIKDKDNNILKKYCYQYVGQTIGCELSTNTTPYWYPNGKVRCLPCPANNAYFSTVKEIEETDINPLSPTAGTTRWVTAVNDLCEPIADWVVISTICEFKEDSEEYSGYQIITEKDQNPCSATYNETREIKLYRPETCTSEGVNPCAHLGPQYKYIGETCEEGVRKNISSVLILRKWYCTYIYQWSDCTHSEEFVEVSNSSCAQQFVCF